MVRSSEQRGRGQEEINGRRQRQVGKNCCSSVVGDVLHPRPEQDQQTMTTTLTQQQRQQLRTTTAAATRNKQREKSTPATTAPLITCYRGRHSTTTAMNRCPRQLTFLTALDDQSHSAATEPAVRRKGGGSLGG